MYFYYGIKHSSLEEGKVQGNADDVVNDSTTGNIELKVTEQHRQTHNQQATSYTNVEQNIYGGQQQLDAFGQPVFGSTNFGGTPTTNYTNQSHSQSPASTTTLFVQQENFPTWDD